MMSKLKFIATGIILSVFATQADAQTVALANNAAYEAKSADDKKSVVTSPAENTAETPALIETISEGHIIEAKEMMNDGFDIAVSDADGLTALHHAAEKGYIELVKKLIREGADVNATDNNGRTALDVVGQTEYKFPREPRVITRLLKAEMKK